MRGSRATEMHRMATTRWVLRDDLGFTIAEYLIAVTILLFVTIATMSALAFSTTASNSISKQETALSLANRRLEQARNMPYDSLGTVGGYPVGTIQPLESVDGYAVATEVGWGIGPDGLSSCKTIHIAVSWTAPSNGKVNIESSIAGESVVANTGDVEVRIVDVDTGSAIQGVPVTVTPFSSAPTMKITDAAGTVRWGKVPAGAIGINATHPDYLLDLNSLQSAAVTSGRLNPWIINAQRPSSIAVSVRNQATAPLPGVTVTITGPSGTLTAVSGPGGTATFSGLLKGTYTVTGALAGYAPSATPPISVISGGQNYVGSLTMVKKTSLTITVVDQSGNAVPGATLALSPSLPIAATDASGRSTVDIVNPGVSYTVTASKGSYVASSGVTGVISAGADATLSIRINQYGTLTVKFTFASGDLSSYTVRVYDASHIQTISFKVSKPSGGGIVPTGVPLPAGQYSVSTGTPWSAKAVNAPILGAGGASTVNMTKAN